MFRKLLRFSTFFKVLTVICMASLLLAYLAPFVHPNTLKILPFFGLAYPVFLTLTLILLVFWLIFRSKWAIYTILVLIIGGKLHFRMLALGSEPSEIPEQEQLLNVMSYNVRLFDLYTSEQEERESYRNEIFNYIVGENPDIICFQEFYHQDKPTKYSTRDTLIQLLKVKDYHERFAHKLRGRQNFGVSILSKYPMIAKGDIMFEVADDNDFNYCIYVDIVKNMDTFRVYNVHLQSIKLQQEDNALFNGDTPQEKKSTLRLLIDKLRIAYPKRAEQARTVMEHVKTSPYPTIVCGDFNDTPMSYSYNQFNKVLTDAYRYCSRGIGATYVGKVPAGRIDYIFHSSDLKSTQFKIQDKALSDHLAISCKIFKKGLE